MSRANVNGSLYLSSRVSGATNASPVVITTAAAHNLVTGQTVTVENVQGNKGANGTFAITVVTSTTFSMTGSVGTGAYISGGTVKSKFSGARTASVNTDPVHSPDAIAIHVIIDVTAVASTPSIVPTIQGYAAQSGVWYDILVGNAITATGTTVLKVGLNIAPSVNSAAQDLIPEQWRVEMVAADSDSITYTIEYNMTNK